MTRSALLLVTLVVLAGCARSEDASVAGDFNDLQPAIERRPQREAENEEIAIGAWRETLQEDVPALEFGPEGTPPQFSLRCAANRGLLLQRHGAAPMGNLPTMQVAVGREDRRLAVTASGGSVPMLRAAVGPDDALVTALRGAATPISIRIGDAPPLLLPPGPEIAAFLTRCSGGAAPEAGATATPAEANGAEPATNGTAAR